jgi:hypothetical protein
LYSRAGPDYLGGLVWMVKGWRKPSSCTVQYHASDFDSIA